jgi:hypothetical protein
LSRQTYEEVEVEVEVMVVVVVRRLPKHHHQEGASGRLLVTLLAWRR